MAITPKKQTIEEIFGSITYSIDFYQRDYKWSDSVTEANYKPIKSLLDDIFYRFNLFYKEESDISKETIATYGWYYLNSYMTNTVDGKVYIVDGQQRLTTLTILAIALYKIGIKLGAEKGKLQYISKKICDYDANGDEVFWMGFPDRKDALDNIYNAEIDHKIELPEKLNVSETNIYDAYNVVYKYLEDRIKTTKSFDAFRLYLFTRVYLINIDVDEPEEVAMVFEVINDRGVPLKAHEILKGKILGIIPKTEVDTYTTQWESIISKISGFNGKDEDVDYFFGAYFQAKYSNSISEYRDLQRDRYHKAIYLEEYDKRIGFKKQKDNSNSISKVKNFVSKELSFFGNLYLRLMEDTKKDAHNINDAWFNAINAQDTQCYLILSGISLDDPEKEEKYALITHEFDRLYTLVNLLGSYKSNDFGADVIDLGQKIREKNCSEIKKEFDAKLLSIISKAHNREDISEPFKYDLFANIGYSNLGSRFMRYFFSRIDHFIADNSNLSTGSYYSHISQGKGKDVYHIEHILAHDEDGINASMFNDEEEFSTQRNRLGGLLLLKGKDNQSSGNELYEEKKKTYVGNGTLFAQTLLPNFSHSNKGFEEFCKKFNLSFVEYQNFTPSSIEERQKLLFEIIKIIWA